MSSNVRADRADAYEGLITVQPSEEEVKNAITLITHAVAKNTLLAKAEQEQFDKAISVSRRAIGYISSYDSKTQALITDMRSFLENLFESPKFRDKPKSKVAKTAEKVFLIKEAHPSNIIKSKPIQISTVRQKISEEHSFSYNAPLPSGSAEFCFMLHSPINGLTGPFFALSSTPPTQVCASPTKDYSRPTHTTMWSLMMTPISWSKPSPLNDEIELK